MANQEQKTDPTQTATVTTPEVTPPAAQPAPAKPTWDQKKQYAQEISAAQERETNLKNDVTKLQGELADLKGKQAQLDPEAAEFKDAVVAINSITERLTEFDKKLSAPPPAASEPAAPPPAATGQTEQFPGEAERQAEGSKIINAHLDELDKEHGAQFRNEAHKKATEDFNKSAFSKRDPVTGVYPASGEENQQYIFARLDHHYQTLKATAKSANAEGSEPGQEPHLQAGSPTGGAAVGNASYDDIEEGSLSQVTKAMQTQASRQALTR